jgi:hypothetical protein
VIGYQVCGQKTEEWYHWSMNTPELGDYSQPMQTAFRGWLSDKYGTDAAIQTAWNKSDATLANAAIPSKDERYGDKESTFRNPEKEMATIDFHRFWSDVMVDTIAYFARVIKEEAGATALVGAFYAYSFEFADLVEDAGHLSLDRLLECRDIDFIMAPSSYYRRNLRGGQSLYRAPVMSINQHQKFLWNDFDPASYKFYEKDQAALAPWVDSLAVTKTPEEFTYMIRRDLGNALANGVNMACFDLHGGYYSDPVIMDAVKSSIAIRDKALTLDRSSESEILVVFDEDSQHFVSFRNPVSKNFLVQQIAELPFVAPYDATLLSCLDHVDTAQYKLVIMLNTFRLDATQRDLIDRKLKNNGRNILWLYAPGYFRGDTVSADPSGISDLTDIPVQTQPRPVTDAKAEFGGDIPPVSLPQGDSFIVPATDGIEILARRSDTREMVVAKRDAGEWTSIYSAAAPLPRQFVRQIASNAGVHLYHEKPEDSLYANKSFLTLAASETAGPRTLRLKRPATVRDAVTNEVMCTNADTFTADFKTTETRVFVLENVKAKEPWYRNTLVGTEVGPTGAQFGSDNKESGYAAKFSGTDIVNEQIRIGSQYLVIWAKDSEYAHYDSKVAPKCPGMGDRDTLREAVEAAKPYGLPVVAYCVVQGNGYPLRNHPEYKMVGADGKTLDRICLNSGYMEHAKAVVEEMAAYGINGFHIDMLDQGFGPPYGCWCASCKEKYQAEYGEPMPVGVTWDSGWDKMLTFRYNTSERFEIALRDHIKSINSDLSVDFNYHGYPPFSFEVGQRPVQHSHIGDFVTCESGVWGFSALGAGLTAQFVRATDPSAPYQVVMQRGARMYHDQTTRTVNDMRWEMFALLANGAQVTIVDKTPFDGSLDRETYDRMGKVFSEVHAKAEHFGHDPIQDVGLYYSQRTRDWVGRETPAKYEQSFFGIHKAMVYEHIPYGVVLDENITLDRLASFPVILLSDVSILSENEVALLKTYVENGGNLILTGLTGTHDWMGNPLTKSTIEELAGASLQETLKDNDNFYSLPKLDGDKAALGCDIRPDWPILAYAPAAIYKATTAESIGTLYRPVRSLRQKTGLEGTTFPSSAGTPVGPALLLNTLGKGSVLTIAVSPGAAVAGEYRTIETRTLIRNAIRYLHPDPEVQIDAPRNIETVVTDDPDTRTLRVHLVGYLSPPGTTSPNRPYLLPDQVEDEPMYKASIRVKRAISEVLATDPETILDQNGQNVDIIIHNIHEVLRIKY